MIMSAITGEFQYFAIIARDNEDVFTIVRDDLNFPVVTEGNDDALMIMHNVQNVVSIARFVDGVFAIAGDAHMISWRSWETMMFLHDHKRV